MKEVRTFYISIILITLVFLYFFSLPFLLILLLIELFLPFLLHMTLLFDKRRMTFHYHFPHSSKASHQLKGIIQVKKPRFLISTGFIQMELLTKHVLFRKEITKTIHIPLTSYSNELSFELDSSLAGECVIECVSLYLYDLFGITRIKLEKPSAQRLMIYPKMIDIQVEEDLKKRNVLKGDTTFQHQKGNDLSEIYDLKLYQPGDDIRSIHWKLSSKLDQEILKEGTHLFGYQILTLCDLVTFDHWDEEIINGCIQFITSFVYKLLYHSDDFCIGFVDQAMHYEPMRNENDYHHFLNHYLSTPFLKKKGEAVSYFLVDENHSVFSHIIYITTGSFPEELKLLEGRMSVLAICIKPSGDQISLNTKGTIDCIEIPYSLIDTKQYTLYI